VKKGANELRKSQELTNPSSCMSRAKDDEMTFVLLGRDAAAPATIRWWAQERVRMGKNTWKDAQIMEAMQCAATMELETKKRRVSDAWVMDQFQFPQVHSGATSAQTGLV